LNVVIYVDRFPALWWAMNGMSVDFDTCVAALREQGIGFYLEWLDTTNGRTASE